jgi:hypothetical protein
MEKNSSIDALPENQEFVLEITNKKPGWFVRFGGYLIIMAVLIMTLAIYIMFRNYGIL